VIRTSAEYKEALDFIDKDIELYDFDLSEKMTSYEYNLYLQDTEFYLDTLYEKMRTLEDIVEYLEYYSNVKISKLKENIKNKQNVLEKVVDRYTDKTAIAYSIIWDQNSMVDIKDRDGSIIAAAEIDNNGSISAGGERSNYAIIKNIVKKSSHDTYSDNISSCVKDNIYLTFYNLEAPEKIEEELTVEALNNDKVNCIEFEPINCEITFEGLNDQNQYVFKLKCNNATKEYENFNYKVFSESNLDSINNLGFNYNQSQTINKNQAVLTDQLDQKYKNSYLKDIKNYQNIKENQLKKSRIIKESEE